MERFSWYSFAVSITFNGKMKGDHGMNVYYILTRLSTKDKILFRCNKGNSQQSADTKFQQKAFYKVVDFGSVPFT